MVSPAHARALSSSSFITCPEHERNKQEASPIEKVPGCVLEIFADLHLLLNLNNCLDVFRQMYVRRKYMLLRFSEKTTLQFTDNQLIKLSIDALFRIA